MQQVLDFLDLHSVSLIELLLSIIILLIAIFKKKVIISSIFESVLMVLPGYIREAENKYSDGSLKYSYVFNRVVEYLELMTGETKQRVIEVYTAKINAAIENILSTPQKKER